METMTIIWSWEDVQSVRPDLNKDQCCEVLAMCDDAHDCNFGMTWGHIEAQSETLFGYAPDDEEI